MGLPFSVYIFMSTISELYVAIIVSRTEWDARFVGRFPSAFNLCTVYYNYPR
jgi:hypothetical protein